MKARILLILFIFTCLGTASTLSAQEQSQPVMQQGPTVVMPASIDNQGIRNYLLGPGDTLEVRVFGQPDFGGQADVDSAGNISLPFIDKPIPAQCRTEKDVSKDIATAYSKYLKNPQVSVRIMGRNSRPPAIVHGAVNSPGQFQMQRRVRLQEVLARAGGVTERANGVIQVLHTESVMCHEPGEVPEPEASVALSDGTKMPAFKLYKYADILTGNADVNPYVRPGDIIRAMEAEPVYITGSVNSPTGLYLREQMTLSRAIAMVGGPKKEAKQSEIIIYRRKPGSVEAEKMVVNLAAIKKGKEKDVLLQAYDIIEVPEAGMLSKERIFQTIAGGVLSGFSGVGQLATQTLPLRVIY
ncbi:MAG TPA: SLBB domain-containing protein [Pyrinomonadaceae bacterium]|jgi:polysaccharide export outer membrane protein